MSRPVVFALALTCLAASALADITLPRPIPDVDAPSPAARTCDVVFRPHTPVFTTCQQTCYAESWDGPILTAVDTCSFPIWVSYIYSAADGRTWRTPCFRLDPDTAPVSIPDPNIEPYAERRIHVAQEPGTQGFKIPGPSAQCPDEREVQPSTTE